MGNSPNWEEIRTRTIAQRNDNLDKYLPIFREIIATNKLTPERIREVVKMNTPQLVRELNTWAITSEQLLAIYGERAATIGRKNCIITEDYFEYAWKKARECDQERQRSKKRNWTMEDEWDMQKFFPPLYGIPTSIKENINMENTRSTLGATIRADRFIKEDCATIKCMKHTGMIPFIKTNLPQLAFNFDCNNHLWGRGLNPWNPKKSPGGSSGGQGAVIASKISPIGIGNDMAGSIRIPAAFNGICGLCPSADRLPFRKQLCEYSLGFEGLDTLMAVNGPMARSIDDLALWMRNMTEEQFYLGEHDVYKKLFPFNIKTYKDYAEGNRKLKIGFLKSYDIIEPTPAVQRAISETVAFLESQGHQLIEIQIPNQKELLLSCFTELLAEGDLKSFDDVLEGEDFVNEYKQLKFLTTRGTVVYGLISCILNMMYPRMGWAAEAGKRKSVHEYLQNVGRIGRMKDQWISYWRKLQLDFLIFPGFASQATSHGASKDGSYLATYTYIFNILRMTSCSMPITLTRADELHYESKWQDPVTELIRNNLKDAEGLPVSIQVVGLPFEEEKVLGLAKRIERHFKFAEKHPYPDL